jgi:DNA polymerase-1
VIIQVPPTGSPNSAIALVGEQPGKYEIIQKKPFVGPAGRQLDECLNAAGISRHECYITNVIKDLMHPLVYYIDLSKRPPRVSPAGQECIDFLEEELKKCSANVIVPIGNIALFAICGLVGITKYRGSVLESTLCFGRKTIATLHPATIIPPKNQYLNRHLIIYDLKRAKAQSTLPEIEYTPRNLVLRPSYSEVILELKGLEYEGLNGTVIFYDIELFNEEVSCISFSCQPRRAICIPFIHSQGDYFTVEQETEVWRRIGAILENRKIRKGGQNIAFDSHFLLRKYGIKARNLDDTMVAQKILFPDYPVGLQFITTMYTDIPYYKDDGKRWFRVGGSWEALWRYNSLDSISCAEALPKQKLDLERMDNLITYDRQTKIIEPLVYMMERGIRVDVEGMRKEGERCERKIEELQGELNAVAGRELNPNSSQQLVQYFYVEKGIPPYHKVTKGESRITVDDTALSRLIRKGIAEASLIREIRELGKLRSNYLNLDKVDRDGRIRCSYNPAGTRFSRLSSSENVFGTGMNMQNWPHKTLKFLLPDKRYIYYSLDMSQIENRIVAYVGRIPQMIDAFENDIDVHRLTASLIFGKPASEISDEDGSSPLAGGKYSERFWGKKANHALNYGLGYRKFALTHELPETEANWIVERYHTAYPGVRQTYHAMIREQLARDRTITNLFGRKTLFLGQWGEDLFKEAYSCIPQGTTGDKINEQGINFIYYNQDRFRPVELLIQVHDSIGFQIPTSVSWERHADCLIRIKDSLETPLVWREREFVVPADLTMGLNFHKEGDLCITIKHKNFPSTKEKLAQMLKENYDKLCHRAASLEIG